MARVVGASSDAKDESQIQIPPDQGLTVAGSVVGTVAYMSPEQANGLPVGPSSDVWSLGAVLFELLTGRPPFTGPDAMAVLVQVQRGAAPSARAHCPECPADLEAIVRRALGSDPRDRYPTAADLARDVERWRTGDRVSAHTYGWLEDFRRFARPNRALVGVTSVAAAALAIGGAAAYRRVAAERDLAEIRAVESEVARLVAEGHLSESGRFHSRALVEYAAAASLSLEAGRAPDGDLVAHLTRTLRSHPHIHEIPAADANIEAFVVSPDGATLTLGTGAGMAVWDLATGEQTGAIPVVGVVVDLRTSATGHRVLARSVVDTASVVSVFALPSGELLGTWPLGPGSRVEGIDLSPDGRRVAATHTPDGGTGRLRVWEVGRTAPVVDVEIGPARVAKVVSFDGSGDAVLVELGGDSILVPLDGSTPRCSALPGDGRETDWSACPTTPGTAWTCGWSVGGAEGMLPSPGARPSPTGSPTRSRRPQGSRPSSPTWS